MFSVGLICSFCFCCFLVFSISPGSRIGSRKLPKKWIHFLDLTNLESTLSFFPANFPKAARISFPSFARSIPRHHEVYIGISRRHPSPCPGTVLQHSLQGLSIPYCMNSKRLSRWRQLILAILGKMFFLNFLFMKTFPRLSIRQENTLCFVSRVLDRDQEATIWDKSDFKYKNCLLYVSPCSFCKSEG